MGPFAVIRVYVNLAGISLLSGRHCGSEGEELPSQPSVSVEGVSQDRNPKAAVSTQETYPCDVCVKDISHLAAHQASYPGHKPCVC